MCTPARAALLTGRLGMRTGVVENFGTLSLHGLNTSEITLASLLQEAGYATMLLGKWHLGHAPAYQPLARGFDRFVGTPYSWDMGCADGQNGQAWYDNYCSAAPFRLSCPTWWGDEAMCQGAQAGNPAVPLLDGQTVVEQPANLSTVAHRLDDLAVAFIAAHAAPSSRKRQRGSGSRDGRADVGVAGMQNGGGAGESSHVVGTEGAGQHHASSSRPRPFFLLYSMLHMHAPQAFLPEFLHASSSQSPYGAALRELDNSVHRIWTALEAAGMLEERGEGKAREEGVKEGGEVEEGGGGTLVIFTSDNGPWDIKCNWRRRLGLERVEAEWRGGSAWGEQRGTNGVDHLGGDQGPFLGAWQLDPRGGGGGATGKFTTFEGGHRVPAIAWWPGVLAPSAVSWPASHLDILPTVLAAAAVQMPVDRAYDGMNLLPYLRTANPLSNRGLAANHLVPPERALFHMGDPSAPGGAQVDAVRLGRFKVFFRTCSAAACGELYYTCGHLSNSTRVFDLDADPSESSPLAPTSSEAQAAVLAAQRAKEELLESVRAGLYTGTNFSSGTAPQDWVCCDPEQISCRCSDGGMDTSKAQDHRLEGKRSTLTRSTVGSNGGVPEQYEAGLRQPEPEEGGTSSTTMRALRRVAQVQ